MICCSHIIEWDGAALSSILYHIHTFIFCLECRKDEWENRERFREDANYLQWGTCPSEICTTWRRAPGMRTWEVTHFSDLWLFTGGHLTVLPSYHSSLSPSKNTCMAEVSIIMLQTCRIQWYLKGGFSLHLRPGPIYGFFHHLKGRLYPISAPSYIITSSWIGCMQAKLYKSDAII